MARLVVQKARGTPLFVRQFLLALHHEGLIKQNWEYDWDRSRALDVGSHGPLDEQILLTTSVDLLLSELKRLAPGTQEALQLAACIGTRFDMDTLALIQKSMPRGGI